MGSTSRVSVLLVLAALVGGAEGAAESAPPAGTLDVRAALTMEARRGDYCPPGTSSSVECYSRQGQGVVRGLGKVIQSYLYLVETRPSRCAAGSFALLATAVRLTVTGKGEIMVALAASTDCLSLNNVLTPTRPFIITGGTGAFAGASGSGTVSHNASFVPTGARGIDTWTGTLEVDGLAFDITAPTLSGAVGKTARAPRGAKGVRVTYSVTARDEADGAVPVSCQPRSSAFFKIGRTVVSCSATDTSGNAVSAKFTVIVKARK